MVRVTTVALVWCVPLWAQAATPLLPNLTRNRVALGDPVVLTFTTDGMVNGEPDFAPCSRILS